MTERIIVPDIGDFEEVEIIDVLVKIGDVVEKEQSLITLESDKATMDVPSPLAGKITHVAVKSGDKVRQGDHIADVLVDGAAADDSAAAAAAAGEKPDEPASAVSPPPDKAAPAAPEAVAASQDAGGTGGSKEIHLPNIGDFSAVEIIDVLVGEGDEVAVDQSLLTLESDKATMDVPSPAAGKIAKLHVAVGDKVSEGDLIATLAGGAAGADATPAAKTPPAPKPASPPAAPDARKLAPLPPVVEGGYAKPHAGPGVRRFARELGADLAQVHGSGPKGRILKDDVKKHVKAQLQKPAGDSGAALPTMPEIDFRAFGDVEIHPLSRINKLSAANLHRNWLLAPHVTQCADADITDMEEFRLSLADEAKKNGYKMTPLAFLIKAAVATLKVFPRFNASLQTDGEHLALKKYFHIGVAVDTPNGLVVPVVFDADRKGLADLARELADISQKARDGKLKREDMQGGCFTISSLGGIGGNYFTPIINLPEVAILGVSRAEMKPCWNKADKTFEPRLKLPLSLSYDHRVIDGASGARFITHYAELLGDIRRLTL